MLTAYRRILVLPGAAAFSLAGFVCRTPISMVGLATVLLVQDRTGSYGIAGAVAATTGLAGGVGSPLQGRLSDRIGQRWVLPVTAAVFVAGICVLILATGAGQVVPLAFVGAALTGAGLPQAGSMVRTRWRHVTPDRQRLQTAFAFEAVVDEVIFIVGPVVVVAVATAWDPALALVLPAATGALGAVALALQRRTEPPRTPPPTTTDEPAPPFGWARLAPVVLASAGLGCIFGATEVVTVAFADEREAPGAAALLLALWAGGSLVAGVTVGAVGSAWPPLRMFRVATLALGLSFVPMLFVEDVLPAAAVLLLSGVAISPSLVASISLVERVVPSARLTEGIGWATSSLTLGVALGAATSGAVVDAAGSSAGFGVPLAAGAVAAGAAWVARDRTVPAPAS